MSLSVELISFDSCRSNLQNLRATIIVLACYVCNIHHWSLICSLMNKNLRAGPGGFPLVSKKSTLICMLSALGIYIFDGFTSVAIITWSIYGIRQRIISGMTALRAGLTMIIRVTGDTYRSCMVLIPCVYYIYRTLVYYSGSLARMDTYIQLTI